ncbi:MAG TPA: GWxTD domain-containing protein [Gemmatimonadales bacterium]|jgi:GWxTD domain-containing protein
MCRFFLSRPAAAGLLFAGTAAIGGCGNWQRVGSAPQPDTQREAAQLLDPNALFTRLGRLVSAQGVPYVGSVAFVAGPGDSTVAIVAISLSNRSFAFEKSGSAFAARYRVEYEFDRPGAQPVMVGRDESIRVESFVETQRTDESILLQQRIALAPGNYQLAVRVRDLGNTQIGTAEKKVVAPVFGPGTYTAPILAYRVRGRATRDDSLSIVLNPRGTLAYGGDTLLIYVEGNGYTKPTDVPLQVRDERDSLVMHTMVHFAGTGAVEGRVVRIAPDSAPLGQLEIAVGNAGRSGSQPEKFAVGPGVDDIHRTSAVVSFSSAWIVTNFDDLLSLLRYFGEDRKIEAMRHAKNSDRIQMWQDFYHSTDPNPSTPENEALDLYFARLSQANQRFREAGDPGWRTDRGEVFITLGEPDEIHDQSAQLQNQGRIIQWQYTEYRLILYFQDISGFARFQLTPQSRSDFDAVRIRLQHNAG